MMDSRPKGNTAPERVQRSGGTRPPGQTPPPGQKRPPGRKKFSWKPFLGAVIAIIVVWQLFHVLTEHPGKTANVGASQSSTSGPVAPSAAPTPTPTVTLGGHAVANSSGPVIVLNPGLVAPGGYVEVSGSGFTPATEVAVWLRAGGTLAVQRWSPRARRVNGARSTRALRCQRQRI